MESQPGKDDRPRFRRRALTEADLQLIRTTAERHRAKGCRVFDDPFARCTCPETECSGVDCSCYGNTELHNPQPGNDVP